METVVYNECIEQIKMNVEIVKYAENFLDLEYSSGRYTTLCCFHKENTPSLLFYPDTQSYFCYGCGAGGDIINFVMEYHKLSFPKAVEKLIKYGNLSIIPKEKSEILDYLYKANLKKKETKTIERTLLPEDLMEQYDKKPIKEWIEEGIKSELLDEYDVRYDIFSNRIVFPIRDIRGNIIAVKARTLYKNYKELGLTKYIYYQPIGNLDFLFGLYRNIDEIKRKKEIIIFEGMKSVLLAEGYNYKNVVSLETNRISEEQVQILLSLKVDIVIALDKGMKIVTKKTKNQNSNVNINIGSLSKLSNVYIVDDKQNLLPDKASPVDYGKEIWEQLYESRYKI